MDFGSRALLAGAPLQDLEDIYQDDVNDGIASMAKEQAEAWALEYEELQGAEAADGSESKDDQGGGCAAAADRKAFLSSLIALCARVVNSRAGAKAGARFGPMGSRTRVHGALGGNAQKFVQLAQKGIARDLKLAAQKVESAELAAAMQKLNAQASKHLLLESDAARTIASAFKTSFNTLPLGEGYGCDYGADSADSEVQEVVVDVGTSFVKAGFSGDDSPRAVFPSIIGRAKHRGVMVGMDQKDAYVGGEAQSKRGVLTLKYPIDKGTVTNWDDFEKLLHHTFYNELRVAPEEQPVNILTQPTSELQMSKILQLLFETFNCPQVRMLAIPTMSVIEQGKMNSIIVDMGARSVRIAAVVNGAIVDGSFVHLGYGGDDVTDYQMKIMTERGYSFTTTSERDIVRDIKEKLSRSALDLNQVFADPASARTNYELPDGQVMTLDTERFRVNEVWFAPAVLGKPDLSVQSAIAVVLSRVPPELRLFLLNNVMMAGGPAMTQGLSERLALELKKILPASLLQGDSIRIQKIPASKYTSWAGASVLTSLRHFRANPAASGGINRAEYDAYGPAECARYAMAFQFSQPPARSDEAEAAEVCSAASSTASIAKNDAPVDVKIAKKKKKIVPQDDVQTTVAPKGASVILADLPASASKTSEVSPSHSEAYHGEAKQPEGKTEGQTNIDDVVCTKTLAHCNQVLISPADLIQKPVASVHTMDNLPLQCEHCPGYFTSQNCFVIDAHNTTKWSCKFCGTMQSAASKRPDVPATLNTQELEYLPTAVSTAESKESKDAALSSVAAKKHLVVFVIDSSGSMQATTHVPLGVKLHVAFKDTKTFTHVSRLQFVQSAVRAKVLALARDDPSAIPLIVHFGSKVTVCCPDGTEQIIEGSVLHSSDALIAKGASIVERFTTACGGAGMRSGCRTLLRQLHGINPKGCTALGPALSCAVGMCGKYDSSSAQIVVCTDGEANTGVGTLNNKKDDSGFYASLAQVARDQGTSVSIMTIEGCEAGMEVLGTTADVTGGKVVVVDPNDLQKSFSSMASEIVTATDVNLTVVAGSGAKVAASLTSEGKASAPWKSFTTLNIGNATSGSSRSFSFALNQVQAATAKEEEEEKDDDADFDECPDAFLCPISLDMMTDPVIMSDGYSYEKAVAVDWLSRKDMSPMTGKPLGNTTLIPNVALRHSIEDFLARKAKQTAAIAPEETEKEKDAEQVVVEEPAGAVSHIPVQVQLTFTDPAGVTHVRLFTLQRKVSNSRKTVEASCNATVVAMETLHKAAALSQKGMYQEARIELISTQRLLQRSMTIPSQATYMTFVCLAEKLDQFMREAALQKDILQNTKAADQKDDEASMGMYNLKSLSRSEFEEQLATLVGC